MLWHDILMVCWGHKNPELYDAIIYTLSSAFNIDQPQPRLVIMNCRDFFLIIEQNKYYFQSFLKFSSEVFCNLFFNFIIKKKDNPSPGSDMVTPVTAEI